MWSVQRDLSGRASGWDVTCSGWKCPQSFLEAAFISSWAAADMGRIAASCHARHFVAKS
jgi:hypothetical protein